MDLIYMFIIAVLWVAYFISARFADGMRYNATNENDETLQAIKIRTAQHLRYLELLMPTAIVVTALIAIADLAN